MSDDRNLLVATSADADAPGPRKKTLIPEGLLPSYLAHAFGVLYEEDGLVVLGKGLGWLSLLASFVRFYADLEEGHASLANEESSEQKVKPPLVLVLGLRDSEFETLISLLQTWGTPNDMLPTIITNEAGQGKDRFEMYQRGGVFCITSRILIVDLLTNVICSEDIDGLLVGHADQVTNDSTAAFIIRIYTSQKRRDRCFIKAFTDYPDALLTGFAKVDKVLKALQVRQLYLYPRFHDVIKNELEQNPPEVEELHQPLSPAMKEIQSAIVAAIQTCMRELKASTPFIEWTGAEFSIENCVTQSFDRAVFHQLRKDWFKLKPQTKQLHQDLKTLRRLFEALIQYDCVNFWKLINSIKTISAASRNPSMWLLTPAAEVLFKKAKERIYRIESKLVPVLEENPKWRLLKTVLSEIKNIEREKTRRRSATILVMAKDERSVETLREYLVNGRDKTMALSWLNYLENYNDKSRTIEVDKMSKETRLLFEEENKVRRIIFGGGAKKKSSSNKRNFQLNQVPDYMRKRRRIAIEQGRGKVTGSIEDRERQAVLDEAVEATEHDLDDINRTRLEWREVMEDPDDYLYDTMFQVSFIEEPRIIVKSLASMEGDAGGLLLQDLEPNYIILYDTEIAFVRLVEVYSALRSSDEDSVKVYFLMFEASAEQKLFMNFLAREQNAFERLIQHKRTMPPPVLRVEGTQEMQQAMSNGAVKATYQGGTLPLAADTRRGRGKTRPNSEKRDIAVDVREFRSSLPSILHKGGMRLAPVTLTVGDFVLSKVHCVERKSISDLFGSFASGRLYTQAEAMSKYYKCPSLLIEFDEDKDFCLQNSNELGMDIKVDSTCSKMVLLTTHFPKLRILWSRSPNETLRVFKELKSSHEEVDVEQAVEIGRSESVEALLKQGDDDDEDEVNEAARDMLLRLPGVNVHNARRIMRNCDSLAELCEMSREQLKKVAGPVAGQKIFTFFNNRLPS